MNVRVLPQFARKYYTKPRHLKKGSFTKGQAYKVHGFDHDSNGNGYVILVNNYQEIWWVNNRHVRVVAGTGSLARDLLNWMKT